jgi:ribokinase
MTIAIVGSANVDLAARVENLPLAGQTVLARDYLTGPGGKGCNQAIAVARLGENPLFIARIGDDALGDSLLSALREERIDTSHILRSRDHQTGMALINISICGENMITVAAGANSARLRHDIHENRELLSRCSHLLVQLECPVTTIACAMKYAREEGACVILDPAPVADHVVMRDLLELVDIVTPNIAECRQMTGIEPTDIDSARAAATRLHEMGARIAIITMGAMGAYFSDGACANHVPVFELDPVDTVGAGDCFNAGLAVALYEGASLEQAVQFASAAGGLATTRHGAAASAPYRAQVDALLRNQIRV